MTEQAIFLKRQQEQIKNIRRMQIIKDKQALDKCIAFWNNKFQINNKNNS